MLLKTAKEIEIMRAGGKILAKVRDKLAEEAREGVILKELDRLAEKLIKKAGGRPAFLGYKPEGADKPYPASVCASVNEVIVHGLPNNYRLQLGDILKIDLGLLYKGYYTDTAITVGIGKISPLAEKLISTAKKALELAIEECQPGKTLGDIGHVISQQVESHGFSIVKELTGHGIGKKLHEQPIVFNNGQPGAGVILAEGMTLAIEPMISAGGAEIIKLPDDSYATKDKSLSAHFEHTVAIIKDGSRILTI